jgi:GntR family transcriptional repressor for pyruvate dehydrogenase complex
MATPNLVEDDFVRLEECLVQMDAARGVSTFIEADAAFHRVILDACGNAALASLIQNLSSGTLRARLWQSIVERSATDATLAAHRAIYDALVVRDADMAAAADLMHLGIAEDWLRRVVEGRDES